MSGRGCSDTAIRDRRKSAFAPRYILIGLIACLCLACIPSIASADVDMTGKIAPGPALKSGLSSPGFGAEPLVNSEHDGVYHCSDAYSTIANVAGGLAIGNCPRNEELDVEDYGNGGEESGYFYGGYFANLGVCAWVKISEALKEKGGNLGHCSGGIGYKYGTFYSQINSESVHDGFYVTNSVACEEYANVDPWGADSATGPIRSVAPYTPGPEPGYPALLWRYVTNNGKYVMVRDARVGGGEGNWAFVERSCLPALPTKSEALPKPTVTTGTPTGITTTTATLVGFVNPNGPSAKYYFEYTTSPTFERVTPTPIGEVGPGTGVVQENVPITNLAAGTTYYFRIVASTVGGETFGGPVAFTTPNPPPTVSTSAASAIQQGQATLNGNVNGNGLNTTYHFQYGETEAYGSSTPSVEVGSGSSSPSVTVTNLQPGTTYHYRIVATNSSGTTDGSDVVFTTLPEQHSNPTWAVRNVNTGQQSVYYVGSEHAIWEWAYYPGSGWESFRVGGEAETGTNPSATVYEGNQMRVYYTGTNHAIWELAWNGSSWGSRQLGGEVEAGTSPSARTWGKSEMRVYYTAKNHQVCEWGYAGTEWGSRCLGGEVETGTSPSATTYLSNEMRVYFTAKNHQVCEWGWSGTEWASRCLGGEVEAGASPSASTYLTNQMRVYYAASNHQVCEWGWTGTEWATRCLGGIAPEAKTRPAVVMEPYTGDAWVYYRGGGGIVSWAWNGAEWTNATL
jgi:FlaG/FlaF family flagellin (archaellin)